MSNNISINTPLKNITAVYAGSFDPLTLGHLDIIKRGVEIFDRVVVATAENYSKSSLFDVSKRVSLIEEVILDEKIDSVKVDTFSGLLVDYCSKNKFSIILRGLRAVSDYEYESKLAMTNRHLSEQSAPKNQKSLETVFLMTATNYSFISSSMVKEIISLGGNVQGLVPSLIAKELERIKF